MSTTPTDNPSVNKPAHPVTISVNGHDVTVEEHRLTGQAIKDAAIAQGVPIQPDFVLYRKTGENLKKVDDDETVTVHPSEEFRCVAPDDVA